MMLFLPTNLRLLVDQEGAFKIRPRFRDSGARSSSEGARMFGGGRSGSGGQAGPRGACEAGN
eukprot:3499823-Pyramimonas_sp.AAC.1